MRDSVYLGASALPDVIKPLSPRVPGWIKKPVPAEMQTGFPIEVYVNPAHGFVVMSAVEVAVDPHGPELGPEYHLSISASSRTGGKKRIALSDAKAVLRQFGMEGAIEDNHVPNGFVRNYWRPVAESLVGIECSCKDIEPEIKQDKGDFIWRPVS